VVDLRWHLSETLNLKAAFKRSCCPASCRTSCSYVTDPVLEYIRWDPDVSIRTADHEVHVADAVGGAHAQSSDGR
jgi:hypothetical protein